MPIPPEPSLTNPIPSDPLATGAPGSLCPQCPLRQQALGSSGSADLEATGGGAAASDPFATGTPRLRDDPHSTSTPALSGPPASSTLPGPGVWTFGQDYEILERVNQGGMGSIYKARQIRANRLVALKMIQPGHLATAEQVERFRREARAAAELHHPGIVIIHDVGEVNGQHYFSMEWLDGGSLKEVLAEGPLPPRLAAELMRQAAEAVEHAHQHGIIHRAIKPHNTMLDRRPAKGSQPTTVPAGGSSAPSGSSLALGEPGWAGLVKLIDFGLARLKEDSELSRTGLVMGTPSYMSPEQARGDLKAIGPWSDVYGLGAVLYQLLSGRPPFHSASEHETLRQVLQEEPVPPKKVNAGVPVDLEKVCLKCLHKERGRRYSSAGELAEELSRFLRGEPVKARPVGMGERGRKWCRRNPALAGMLAALVLVVFGSLVGLTVLYLNAERHRKLAEHEQQIAEYREEGARAITRFYEDHVLAAARPKDWDGGTGKNVTLKEAMDQAAPKIEKAFEGQPELEAAVRNTLGMTYYYLGEFKVASTHLEKAYAIRLKRLPEDHPDTLDCLFNSASIAWRQGKYDKGEAMCHQALEKRRRVLGPEHPDTLWTQLRLGLFLLEQDKLDEAETVLRQGTEACKRRLGPDHVHTLFGQSDLAWVVWSKGKEEEAIDLNRQTLERRQRALGPENPDTLRSMGNLAFFLGNVGKLEEAEMLARKSLEGKRRVLGLEHIETLMGEQYLGDVLGRKGSYAEADKILRHSMEAFRLSLGPKHPYTLWAMAFLGEMLSNAGQPDQAETLLRECLAGREEVLSRSDWEIANTKGLLGYCLAEKGKFTEAEPLLLAGYDRMVKGAPASRVAETLDRIIKLYEKWGRPEQAETWRKKRPGSGK